MRAPFVGSLAPSPQCGGVPLLPPLIDKPYATVATTSYAAIRFTDIVVPPSFLDSTRYLWPMPLALHGHTHQPQTNAEGGLNHLLNVGVGQHNGQLFHKYDRCNCDFYHPNMLLQLCQHRHRRQVLIGDRKLPNNVFFLLGANRLAHASQRAFSKNR